MYELDVVSTVSTMSENRGSVATWRVYVRAHCARPHEKVGRSGTLAPPLGPTCAGGVACFSNDEAFARSGSSMTFVPSGYAAGSTAQ